MMTYPKINTLFKRDERTGKVIEGSISRQEFDNIKNYLVTEKIHGFGIRIIFKPKYPANSNVSEPSVEFKGRHEKSDIPKDTKEYLEKKYTTKKLSTIFKDIEEVVIYGEAYGKNIQGVGHKYSKEIGVILFDIKIDDWWLERDNMEDIAKKLDTPIVPHIGIMTKEEIIEYVKKKPQSKISQKKLIMEGIVAKSHPLMLFRDKTPIMFKLKIKDYLWVQKK